MAGSWSRSASSMRLKPDTCHDLDKGRLSGTALPCASWVTNWVQPPRPPPDVGRSLWILRRLGERKTFAQCGKEPIATAIAPAKPLFLKELVCSRMPGQGRQIAALHQLRCFGLT